MDFREELVNESIRLMAKKAEEDYDAGIINVDAIMCPLLSEVDKRELAIYTITHSRIARMARLN